MVESKHHILKKSKVFLAKQSVVKTYQDQLAKPFNWDKNVFNNKKNAAKVGTFSVNLGLTLRLYLHPLNLKVNSSPLKKSDHPERNVHFQPSIFQEAMFNSGEFLLWVEKPPAAVVSPAVLGQETSSLRNWAIRRSNRLRKPGWWRWDLSQGLQMAGSSGEWDLNIDLSMMSLRVLENNHI